MLPPQIVIALRLLDFRESLRNADLADGFGISGDQPWRTEFVRYRSARNGVYQNDAIFHPKRHVRWDFHAVIISGLGQKVNPVALPALPITLAVRPVVWQRGLARAGGGDGPVAQG